MKIGNPADKPALAPVSTGRSAPADAKSGTTTAAADEASAKVELSNTAATLLSGVGGATPEFDTEKVSRIARAIEEGRFTVNHEAIADKLIANARELLDKSSH